MPTGIYAFSPSNIEQPQLNFEPTIAKFYYSFFFNVICHLKVLFLLSFQCLGDVAVVRQKRIPLSIHQHV